MTERRWWIVRSRLAWLRHASHGTGKFTRLFAGFARTGRTGLDGYYTMGTRFVRKSSTRSAGTSLYCTVVWI
jgi:hypothetical protein